MSELSCYLTIVSYKHNVVDKQGSSKPLRTNELWLLELQIESTRILASIPDALWELGYVQIVYTNSLHLSLYGGVSLKIEFMQEHIKCINLIVFLI